MGIVVSSTHVSDTCKERNLQSSAQPGVLPTEDSLLQTAPMLILPMGHRRQSSTNFSRMSPSYRLQLFMNCSSMGAFHRVQSFMNRLLQHESPLLWITSPDSKPTPVRDPVSRGSEVLKEACSSMDFPQGHRIFLALTCSGMQFSTAATWISASLWTPWDGRVQLSHHRLQGNLVSSAWGTTCHSFCTDLAVCRVVPLSHSHCSLPAAVEQ